MAKQTAKTKADRVRDLYVNLNGASRQRWEKINQQGHDFYLDNQLTQEENETLERQGMPTFTINRIIPIVEMLNFYVTANQPRWQAIGVEVSDVNVANADSIHNSAIEHQIAKGWDDQYFDGYLAEIVFTDGQAYAASDFGEFDEDSPTIWKPKDPSGLTMSGNSYWLDFEDSSALGNDVSGNNNDWTATNLAAVDQSLDSPTNNFATLNPLQNYYDSATFSQGNNVITTANSTGNYSYRTTTQGMTAGKWYAEFLKTGAASHGIIGIASSMPTANNHWVGLATNA